MIEKYSGKLIENLVQSANVPANMRTVMCARCVKPIEGEEHFIVGRYTYGPCCIDKVKQ